MLGMAGLGVRGCLLAFLAAAGFVSPRGPWVKLERPQRERPSGGAGEDEQA
jgi:hypothetical protein